MIVHYIRKTRPSALRLAQKLREMGYTGKVINWGTKEPFALNPPQAVALASNKHKALLTMQEAGVPIPKLVGNTGGRYSLFDFRRLGIEWEYPIVGRPDYHRKGRQFYLCNNYEDVTNALNRGATHFMEYVDNAREFRVHIVNGKSIKISEKIGGGITKNYESGARFYYPEDFNHKKSLRRVAREAVASLGLDFGAVDLLYRDGNFYVLEVNTAPCLTSTSDTLERYARAFYEGATI